MLVVNALLELGMLKKFIPSLGRFFVRFAGLPPEVAAAFISSFGSSYAGGSMLVNLQEKNLLNKQQVFLGALTLSIPTHVREVFSYHLPLVFPLLGVLLGTVYLLVQTLSIVAKFLFVVIVGKLAPHDNVTLEKIAPVEEASHKKNLLEVLWDSIYSCLKPLKRMAVTIPLTALIIFELNGLGVFNNLPVHAESLGLPPYSTACLVSYMAHTLIGLSALAACYQGGETDEQIEDLAAIFHPELYPNYKLKHFVKLTEK